MNSHYTPDDLPFANYGNRMSKIVWPWPNCRFLGSRPGEIPLLRGDALYRVWLALVEDPSLANDGRRWRDTAQVARTSFYRVREQMVKWELLAQDEYGFRLMVYPAHRTRLHRDLNSVDRRILIACQTYGLLPRRAKAELTGIDLHDTRALQREPAELDPPEPWYALQFLDGFDLDRRGTRWKETILDKGNLATIEAYSKVWRPHKDLLVPRYVKSENAFFVSQVERGRLPHIAPPQRPNSVKVWDLVQHELPFEKGRFARALRPQDWSADARYWQRECHKPDCLPPDAGARRVDAGARESHEPHCRVPRTALPSPTNRTAESHKPHSPSPTNRTAESHKPHCDLAVNEREAYNSPPPISERESQRVRESERESARAGESSVEASPLAPAARSLRSPSLRSGFEDRNDPPVESSSPDESGSAPPVDPPDHPPALSPQVQAALDDVWRRYHALPPDLQAAVSRDEQGNPLSSDVYHWEFFLSQGEA